MIRTWDWYEKLYWDYETFLIQPGMQAPPPVCCQLAYNDDPGEILHANFDVKRLEKNLWDALRNPRLQLVAHSAGFEYLVTKAWRTGWIDLLIKAAEEGRFVCTIVDEKLIRIARGDRTEGYGLDDVCNKWLIPHTLQKDNPWRKRFGELWGIPVADWPEQDLPTGPTAYAMEDLIVRKVHKTQRQRVEERIFVDSAPQFRAEITFKSTSAWGFPVDLAAARRLAVETDETLNQFKEQLIAAKILQSEKKKGEFVWVKKKAVATPIITQAYLDMGREPPRGGITATMVKTAYKRAGLEAPDLKRDDEVTEDILNDARDAGADMSVVVGNIKLDEEACLNSGHPLMLAYTRYGQSTTIKSKINRTVRAGEAGKPVQCSYNVLVATGRSSCRQGDDPEPGEAYTAFGMQIQNLPRAGEEFEDDDGKKQNKQGVREIFVAPGYYEHLQRDPEWLQLMKLCAGTKLYPDECIVSVDFDAFEMRTWAQCCLTILGYSDLAKILNDARRCPHIEMGTRLFNEFNEAGLTWEEQYAWGYDLKQSDKKLLKKVRGTAKGPNFGLPGGMGWARLMDYCRLQYGVVLSEEQAKRACAVWREMYSEAQHYLDEITAMVGRRRGSKAEIIQLVSNRVRGEVGFCDGSNGFFQGLAADGAKASGWALYKEAYANYRSPFYGSRPLGFVHDEWLYAVKRRVLHEAAHRMRDVQLGAAQPYCPDVILSASPAAFYRWSKPAGDPYYMKNGRLSTFEDGGELICFEEVPLYT